MNGIALIAIAVLLARAHVPSPSPSPSPSLSPSPSPSESPMPTPSPTETPSVTPTVLPSATIRPSTRATTLQDGDHAYSLIGGEWQCKTVAGTEFRRTYRHDEDAISLIAETYVTVNGHTGKLVEVYRKHRASDQWSVSLADGQIIALAAPWHRGDWLFEGKEAGNSGRVRMIYRSVNADAFKRVFERENGSRYIPFSGETCLRKPA